jgi:hypothetical protein
MTTIHLQQLTGLIVQLMLLFLLDFGLDALFVAVLKEAIW